MSGAVLLCLALFGRPDQYLREARQLVENLRITPDEPAANIAAVSSSPDASQLASQVAQLQRQVIQLQQRLAGNRTPEEALPPPPQLPAQQLPVQLDEAPAHPSPSIVPERREAAKALPPVVPQRPRPAAPASRPDPDDVNTVIARLKQQPPAPQTAPTAPPPPQQQPYDTSPLRQSLLSARSALQSGRMEEGIRALQEVQLRLVFRPVAPDATDPGIAGPAASVVGRALAAAGNNDTLSAQRLIDRALADLSASGSR
ncbi:MAG: hypothetical protein U1E70_09490 [Acetobacteraceae bacterium]|nr:hypothetical protein [Pseudomonadota bacterium]